MSWVQCTTFIRVSTCCFGSSLEMLLTFGPSRSAFDWQFQMFCFPSSHDSRGFLHLQLLLVFFLELF